MLVGGGLLAVPVIPPLALLVQYIIVMSQSSQRLGDQIVQCGMCTEDDKGSASDELGFPTQ